MLPLSCLLILIQSDDLKSLIVLCSVCVPGPDLVTGQKAEKKPVALPPWSLHSSAGDGRCATHTGHSETDALKRETGGGESDWDVGRWAEQTL